MSAESDFQRMILDFMQDDPATAIYTQYKQGTYNVATSKYNTVKVETPCKCILLDLTRNSNGLSSVYGTNIIMGDKDCYIYPTNKADPIAPPLVIDTTSDRVVIAGITYKIEVVKSADPTGANALLYQMMLRR